MTSTHLTLIAVIALLASPATAQPRNRRKGNPVVKIHAAVVVKDLEVKPIPLTEFLLVPDSLKQIPKDQLGGRVFNLRTDLAGWATMEVPKGDYQLLIKQPVVIGLKKYDWNMVVDATAPETITVELTNLNAIITDAPDSSKPKRQITDEAALYQRLRSGVVTVQGEVGSGSGFLFDRRGLIMTNDHVIGTSHEIRVQFDEDHKYLGKLIARDNLRDFAILRVAPEICEKCTVLTLADWRGGRPLAVEGEKVIAIGSPLSQEKIITSGIVSKVEKRALISDININPGNSGGPLINLDGKVIAVNTFSQQQAGSGPGLSGCILISEAERVLAKAQDTLPKTNPPSAMLLPVKPKGRYPVDALKLFARQKNMDFKPYFVDGGDFTVDFLTPPLRYYYQYHEELELAQRKEERERKAGINEGERYDPLRKLRAWAEYAGVYDPVVVIQVLPKSGQTAGSAWANFLSGLAAGMAGTQPYTHYEYEYKTDFANMTVQQNGRVIQPIGRGKFTRKMNVDNYYVTAKDVAYGGWWVLDNQLFAPKYDTLPKITLEIRSLTNPNKPIFIEIPPATVKRIWDDFGPYRYQQNIERKTKNND